MWQASSSSDVGPYPSPPPSSCSAHMRGAFRLISYPHMAWLWGHVCVRPSRVTGLSVIVMSCASASRCSEHPESRRLTQAKRLRVGSEHNSRSELRDGLHTVRCMPAGARRRLRVDSGCARSRCFNQAVQVSARGRVNVPKGVRRSRRGFSSLQKETPHGRDLSPPPEPRLLSGHGSVASGRPAAQWPKPAPGPPESEMTCAPLNVVIVTEVSQALGLSTSQSVHTDSSCGFTPPNSHLTSYLKCRYLSYLRGQSGFRLLLTCRSSPGPGDPSICLPGENVQKDRIQTLVFPFCDQNQELFQGA